jgi:hypothetical protein
MSSILNTGERTSSKASNGGMLFVMNCTDADKFIWYGELFE